MVLILIIMSLLFLVITKGTGFLMSLANSTKYKWGNSFHEECSEWLDMFIKLIDLSHRDSVSNVQYLADRKWNVEWFSALVKKRVSLTALFYK